MKKRIFAILSAISVALSFTASLAAEDISVLLNGSRIEFDTPPEIISDRTFVPIRAIAEALDSSVAWDGENKKVHITKGDTTTILTIDNTEVTTQTPDKTELKTLEAAPYVKDDRTMVPLRFIAEAFGMNVGWDGSTLTVTIDSITESSPEPTISTPSPEDIINEENIPYYTDFSTVPDFGEYFGYNDESTNPHMHYYSETTEEDRNSYLTLLESLGFINVDEYTTSEVESYGYEKGEIQVVVALYNIEGMENVYEIIVKQKTMPFDGEIKYYENYPTIPDCGIIEGLTQVNTIELPDEETGYITTQYLYILSEDAMPDDILIQYTDLLEKCGFFIYSRELMSVIYTDTTADNIIFLEIGLDENNNILIAVTIHGLVGNSI